VSKGTGSMRPIKARTGHPLFSRPAPHRAFCPGTAFPGPVLTSGPGAFLGLQHDLFECAVTTLVPAISSFHSCFILPERKSVCGGVKERTP
jgi:hypothetical protein